MAVGVYSNTPDNKLSPLLALFPGRKGPIWAEAKQKRDAYLAAGHLEKGINAYLEGFKSGILDAYPGINALTLLEIKREPRRSYNTDVIIASGKLCCPPQAELDDGFTQHL